MKYSSSKKKSDITIREIEIQTFVHATESFEKVEKIILSFFDFSFRKAISGISSDCKGIHGQTIKTFNFKIKNKTRIKEVIKFLSLKLKKKDKQRLDSEINSRLDEKFKFYFRFHKQSAALNKFRLTTDKNAIQIVLSIQNKSFKKKLSTKRIRNYLQLINFI